MNLEGFIPYDSAAADLYEKNRWWLGMTMGDMVDKASDLYPQKDALIGPASVIPMPSFVSGST
jgi:2,3-dihydroxybenzoate-AMP ligase/mycobactin salicyl-AMP ligase